MILVAAAALVAASCDEHLPRPDEGAPAPPAPASGLDARPTGGCRPPPKPPPPPAKIAFEPVTGVPTTNPVEIVSHEGRLYVLEQKGRILILGKDGTSATTFADVSSRIIAGGEAGLLGIAFHPKFAQNHFVYLYFTAAHPQDPPPPGVVFQSVVARYESNDGGLTLDRSTEKVLLVVDQPFSNHNGATIAFGKDGFLYWALGDGGGGGGANAQSKTNLLGKILRLDVDGAFPYAIPPSNPFAKAGGRPEIYALGFRNPYRFRFDDVTGDLWVGDVGQAEREEIDKVVLGGNYGWNIREGKTCFETPTCSTTGLIDPVVDHGREDASTITGGVVYHGSALPALKGKYIYSDVATGRFFAIPTNEPSPTPERLDEGVAPTNPTALSIDDTGEIVFTSYLTGAILRVVPPPTTDAPALLSATGCVDAADPTKLGGGLFPYDVNVPQWMDGATAERHLSIPDGKTFVVGPDGKLEPPPGSVAIRTLRDADGRRLETQLLARRDDGAWGAHRYVWTDDQKNATLDPAGTAACVRCHDPKTSPTIGLEAAQLDRDGVDYGGGRRGNPLATLEHVGMLDKPVTPSSYRRLPPTESYAPGAERARAYLHANCAFCHRGGEAPALDLRFGVPLRATQACNVAGSLPTGGAMRLVPGDPEGSQIVSSMRANANANASQAGRMPPVGTNIVDAAGVTLVADWIRSLGGCD